MDDCSTIMIPSSSLFTNQYDQDQYQCTYKCLRNELNIASLIAKQIAEFATMKSQKCDNNVCGKRVMTLFEDHLVYGSLDDQDHHKDLLFCTKCCVRLRGLISGLAEKYQWSNTHIRKNKPTNARLKITKNTVYLLCGDKELSNSSLIRKKGDKYDKQWVYSIANEIMKTPRHKQRGINFVNLVVNIDSSIKEQFQQELIAISGGCPAHGLGRHLAIDIEKWKAVLICQKCNDASITEKYLKDVSS